MAPTPPGQRRLAEGLRLLQLRQHAGVLVFRTADFSRAHRDALVLNGSLRRVSRGWYLPARSGDALGDTTPWYAAMPQFVAGYATVLPRQLINHSPRGTNNVLNLPDGCSFLDYKARDCPATDQTEFRAGLRVLTVPDASDLMRALLAGGGTAPSQTD